MELPKAQNVSIDIGVIGVGGRDFRKRGIPCQPLCPRCSKGVKDVWHALWDSSGHYRIADRESARLARSISRRRSPRVVETEILLIFAPSTSNVATSTPAQALESIPTLPSQDLASRTSPGYTEAESWKRSLDLHGGCVRRQGSGGPDDLL
ncbi:hypothetical protein TIFTF001_004459 [Ficus carica]|uniref:Uncharacterized protein n=1 Tax=Ficus carica TaxID=3494 RepID=A0AA87ZHV4_FICCA|nr:hypothetical protein TIFTF001_004459 [Ficus carica]